MSPANRGSFLSSSISSLPICMPFISFSCLPAMAGTSSTRLNKSEENWHSCLAAYFRKTLSLLPLSTVLSAHNLSVFCIKRRKFSQFLTNWEFLSWNGLNFVKCFSLSFEIIIYFYFVDYIGWFLNVESALHLRNKPQLVLVCIQLDPTYF